MVKQISNETYTDPRTDADSTKGFGTHPLLVGVPNTSGKDRFYAIALSDLATNGTTYHWYYAANGNMSDWDNETTGTSKAFGTGKTNTSRMITKWNNAEYGVRDKACTNHSTQHVDIWGQIQTQASDGWFIPSTEEWSAFGYAMKNNKFQGNSYAILGFSNNNYWSSSQYTKYGAWITSTNAMGWNGVGENYPVRLCTTF